jgi:hypothetical protein
MDLLVCRHKARLFHHAIRGFTWLRIEVAKDKDLLGIDLFFPNTEPVKHLLTLMLPKVVAEFDRFAWIMQMQIDHDHVLKGNIVLDRQHLAIADTAHLKHIV